VSAVLLALFSFGLATAQNADGTKPNLPAWAAKSSLPSGGIALDNRIKLGGEHHA
jgi:hypothetical protein